MLPTEKYEGKKDHTAQKTSHYKGIAESSPFKVASSQMLVYKSLINKGGQ